MPSGASRASYIRIVDWLSSLTQMIQGTLHVHRVPNDNRVDHQP